MEVAYIEWDIWILLTALIVSMYGSTTAFQLLDHIHAIDSAWRRALWIFISAIVMGTVCLWASHFIARESTTLSVRSTGQYLTVRYGLLHMLLVLGVACTTSLFSVFISWGHALREDPSLKMRKSREPLEPLLNTGMRGDHQFLRHLEIDMRQSSMQCGPAHPAHLSKDNEVRRQWLYQFGNSNNSTNAVQIPIPTTPPFRSSGGERGGNDGEEYGAAEEFLDDIYEESDSSQSSNYANDAHGITWKQVKSYLLGGRNSKGISRPGIIRLFISSLVLSVGCTLIQILAIQGLDVEFVNIRIVPVMLFISWAIVLMSTTLSSIILTFVEHHGVLAPIAFSSGLLLSDIFVIVGNAYEVDLEQLPWTRPLLIYISTYKLVLSVAMCTFGLCFAVVVAFCQLAANQQQRFLDVMEDLRDEKRKTDRLLNSIMPQKIAKRIKRGEKSINESHEKVTVIFIDIVNFTLISENMKREYIMQMLHTIFSGFDHLAKKHTVTKLKLVGDCWMGASGLIIKCEDHAAAAVRFALDAMQYVKAFNAEHSSDENWPYVQVKIGMSSGKCISGIIGDQVFQYDIWGPCVNLASRMESLCPASNCIQITETTFHFLMRYVRLHQLRQIQNTPDDGENNEVPKSPTVLSSPETAKSLLRMDNAATALTVEQLPLIFTERGTIQVKGKGAMKTFVCFMLSGEEYRRDKELADAQMTRFRKAEDRAISMFDEGIENVRKGLVHYEHGAMGPSATSPLQGPGQNGMRDDDDNDQELGREERQRKTNSTA